jgi:hypothetical protein
MENVFEAERSEEKLSGLKKFEMDSWAANLAKHSSSLRATMVFCWFSPLIQFQVRYDGRIQQTVKEKIRFETEKIVRLLATNHSRETNAAGDNNQKEKEKRKNREYNRG